jgi:hypothetical protein
VDTVDREAGGAYKQVWAKEGGKERRGRGMGTEDKGGGGKKDNEGRGRLREVSKRTRAKTTEMTAGITGVCARMARLDAVSS